MTDEEEDLIEGEKFWPERVGIETTWHGKGWTCKHSDVQLLWSKVIMKMGREGNAHAVCDRLITVRNIRTYPRPTRLITADEMMGGIYRARDYFPKYYRPMKILAHLKYIAMPSGSKNYKRLLNCQEVSVEGATERSAQMALLEVYPSHSETPTSTDE